MLSFDPGIFNPDNTSETLSDWLGVLQADPDAFLAERLMIGIGLMNRPTETTAELLEQITRITAVLFAQNMILSKLTTRTVTDGVLNSTTSVDSNAANFTSADVGATVYGTGIPDGTTIASVTDENTIVLSAPATITGTGKTLHIAPLAHKAIESLLTRVAALEAA